MPIEGRKVRIRKMSVSDFEEIKSWRKDPEIRKYIGDWDPFDADLEDWKDILRDRSQRVFAIEDPVRGIVIGDLEIQQISWKSKSAEMRICLGLKEYWSRGFGSDAVRSFLEYAFGDLGLNEIYLRVYRSNMRAVRCYEKCGFRKVAILRAGHREKNGHRDLFLMTIRREDFPSDYSVDTASD